MPLEQPTPTLTEHVAEITAAFLSNNAVAADQIPAIIASIHAALGGLVKPIETALPAVLKPAVPIRRSVQPHVITCLDCGYQVQMLKRHLTTAHGLSVDQYRARWALPSDYPMVAPNYTETRSRLAKEIGLGTIARKGRRAQQ
ncbi:MAG TPA: MucR family transcriptional regulator [Stellaceae bacterium]|jgi:predicted transcriptional regulator